MEQFVEEPLLVPPWKRRKILLEQRVEARAEAAVERAARSSAWAGTVDALPDAAVADDAVAGVTPFTVHPSHNCVYVVILLAAGGAVRSLPHSRKQPLVGHVVDTSPKALQQLSAGSRVASCLEVRPGQAAKELHSRSGTTIGRQLARGRRRGRQRI
jgi:hypothetical protein